MSEVSVIIPLYNKGKYIARALDSVFAQTYQDFEVIVVDDGSTDEGPDIVRTYHGHRLRLIQQANSGPGAARNRGIKETNAKYVAFLDADDEWLPEYLRISHETLELHKECGFSVAGWYQDYSQTTEGIRNVNICDIYKKCFGRSLAGVWDVNTMKSDRDLSALLSLLHTNTVFVKASVIRKYKGFLEGYSYGEDIYLWLLLVFNHKFYYIDSPLAWYHDSVSNLGGAFWRRPLHAHYLFYDEICNGCCLENKHLIERWFSINALQESHNRLSAGKIDDVAYLVNKFPKMKIVRPWSYFKLMLKLKIPILRKRVSYQ